MKNGLRFAAFAALFALPLASCSCGEPPITQSGAEIAVSPQQLSWGDVCQESANERSFTITNRGRTTLNANLAIEGAAADFFSLDREALAIDTAGGTAQVKVIFHPTGEDLRGNSYTSEIVITSNGSEQPVRIRLSGRVADVDPTPILSFGCSPDLPLCSESAGGACCFTTCDDPSSPACETRKLQAKTLDFGASIIDEETSVVTARISNLGCGPLEVSEVRLERLFIDTCDPVPGEGGDPVEQVQVKDFAPFVVEGSVDPLSPKSHEVTFEFTPTQAACDVSRKFVLVTNDPAAVPDEPGTPSAGPAAGNLSGRSTRSMLEISPTGNFGKVPSDETKSIQFTIRNANVDQEITIQNLEIGGRDASRFEVTASSKCGDDQGTNPTNILMARSTGTGSSCEDRFLVTIRYTPGLAGGRHEARFNIHHQFGTTGMNLFGDSLPILALYPDRVRFGAPEPQGGAERTCSEDGLSCISGDCMLTCFNDDGCMTGKCLDGICSDEGTICAPACGAATRSMEICNEGIAPLNIQNVEVFGDTDLSPAPRDTFFDDDGPLVFRPAGACDGEVLEPGQCCTETIHFQDSRVGGTTMAALRIMTDSPVWPEGAWVDLISNTTAAGRIPQARIEPIGGTTNPPARSWIRFDGTGSSVGLGELSEFKWHLRPASTAADEIQEHDISNDNPSALCPAHFNGGNCLRFADGGRTLEFWPAHAGRTYTAILRVSSNLCEPHEESAPAQREVVTSDPDI